MIRSFREGRGKRKAGFLDSALDEENEHKAKRPKIVKQTKTVKPQSVDSLSNLILTKVQSSKAAAKVVVLAKKASLKKKKDDRLKLKLARLKAKTEKKAILKKKKDDRLKQKLARLKAKTEKKTEKEVKEKAFIQPYLQRAESCFKASGLERIAVSRAKSQYFLNVSDLSKLEIDSMHRYDAEDVAKVCMDKYQTKEKLARKLAMRDAPKKPRKRRVLADSDDDDDSEESDVLDREEWNDNNSEGSISEDSVEEDMYQRMYDDYYAESSHDGSNTSNDLVCYPCGKTAAVQCTMGRCCHCCNDSSCFRHNDGSYFRREYYDYCEYYD